MLLPRRPFRATACFCVLSVTALLIGAGWGRHATIRVLDAETGTPIESAHVSIYYNDGGIGANPLLSPASSAGKTGRDGTVTLAAADPARYGTTVRVIASDYLTTRELFPVRGFFKGKKERDLTVRVYHGPNPVIELILPKGFRGVAKVTLRPTGRVVQDKPGERRFSVVVPRSGSIEVAAPKCVLDNALTGGRMWWEARYEEGTPIPYEYAVSDLDPGRYK